MYLRTIKVPSSNGKINVYVRLVEAYRQDGKVKQRVVADLGRKDVLAALLPQLQRLLRGDQAMVGQEPQSDVKVLEAATWGPMLLVQRLAGWLESDWVCDTAGRRFAPVWKQRGHVKVEHRQLDRWHRTLDRLAGTKDRIEVDLYARLRDLFSLKGDLVLYDITSSYFEGAGGLGVSRA